MAVVFGGFTAFPLGIYTVAEREALERSDSQPDEVGASEFDITEAVRNRYKLALRVPTASLGTSLNTAGIAMTVGGSNGRFPAGHFLRRWDPGFAGLHEVCVIPLGGGRSLWLDPLAPWRYAGDIVNNTTVLSWAFGGTSYRYVKQDEFLEVSVKIEFKLEKWNLDATSTRIVTIGAPYKSDGTVDYSSRFAITNATTLESIARTRLTAPTAVNDVILRNTLIAYALPIDNTPYNKAELDAAVEAQKTADAASVSSALSAVASAQAALVDWQAFRAASQKVGL